MDISENDLDERCSEDDTDSSDDDASENPEYKRLVDLVWNKQDKNHDSYDIQREVLEKVLKFGDLTLASYSFEIMANCFPLTPEIWKAYINLYSKDDRENLDKLIELYRRALFDYYSFDLQKDFITLILSSDVETIRASFEQALSREGLHPVYGFQIWESYRLYESSRLSIIEEDSPEQEVQLKHLADIIIRQLSTPLQYEEDLLCILTNLNAVAPTLVDLDAAGKSKYEAQKLLEKYLDFENQLEQIQTENSVDKLSIFTNYIAYAQSQSNSNPKFIESLYYRATTEFCLNTNLWQQFCVFAISQHKLESSSITKINVENIIHNALRNVPWGTAIWILKLRWLEYCNANNDDMKSTFEKALSSCNYKVHNIWMAYLEYLKRHTDFSNNDSVNLLRKTFQLCTETLQKHWGTYANPVEILKFWARLEYSVLKDPARGRELWNEVLSYDDNKTEPYLWLEMAKLEEGRGNEQARKIYRRAVLECRSYMLVDAWKTFERMNGTLDTLEKCVQTCDEQAYKISQKDVLQSHGESHKRRYHFNEKTKDHSKKLKFDQDLKERKKLQAKRKKIENKNEEMDCDDDKKTKQIHKSNKNGKESVENIIKDVEMSDLQISSEDKRVQHDPTKDEITIFISNLDYTITEEQLEAILKDKGDLQIKEIRLVKKPNGTNKGYAYIELTDTEQVQKALKMDRTPLSGRPMYISSCHGNKEQRKHGFRYSEELEKNKLFIKGLPFDANSDELKTLFQPYGEIKDIRIVTYRSGKAKGLAFVEYFEESSASAAILKMDNTEVRSHTISVALSAPPPRKNKFSYQNQAPSETQVSNSLGGGVGQAQGAVRKAKMSFIPRSVQKAVAASGSKDVEMTNAENKPKSNDDFRKMLLGNK